MNFKYPMGLFSFVMAIMLTLVSVVAKAEEGAGPVNITADRMESNRKENSIYFAGKVEAKQGNLIIRADEMTVFYKGGSEADGALGAADTSKSISKLLAGGNVEIVSDGWLATGDNVDYFSDERKVVLTGNTKVWQDSNMVSGERIVLYLNEGKSVIERGENGERVKAFFFPEGTKPSPAGGE
ncbi:MAG: lipopolysaccharide transport periplasmic protein LptA [Proteobacteria bacterium]|nr:lipopolysaccharide transport periplasmic protein LptA [Pseudomonadota bacterium]MBU1714378.1 lipopolysaccharide transport periplasmic protein LptA [Pseudomonadota bacterium]